MPVTKKQYYNMLLKAAKDGTFPSYDQKTERCLYRYRGHSCAVGILIPKHISCKSFNSSPMNDIPPRILEKIIPIGLDEDELSDIQSIHDDLAQEESWNAKEFVYAIKSLSCFSEFKKVSKKKVSKKNG